MDHPTMGVEEEFLLVDPETGEPVPLNRDTADQASTRGVDLQLELTSCQVETASEVRSSAAEMHDELRRLRRVVAESAAAAGARLLAAGLPPTVPHEFPITDTPRYREISEKFGMIASEQGICGCHVHVSVPSREAAVDVGNRLRPWLPTLLAISANSAIYRNSDTRHASWRSVLWARWPSAGPPPYFDSVEDYDAVVAMMQDAGAMLDDGMVYWDVRPSANFPTVEVRVADVPATAAQTALLAALIRGAVMTALDERERGEPVLPLTAHALRAAYWKAARDGLDGDGVDLHDTHAAVPAQRLLATFVDRITPALDAVGDADFVRTELARLETTGNGATRQRQAYRRRHDVADVVEQVADATLEGL